MVKTFFLKFYRKLIKKMWQPGFHDCMIFQTRFINLYANQDMLYCSILKINSNFLFRFYHINGKDNLNLLWVLNSTKCPDSHIKWWIWFRKSCILISNTRLSHFLNQFSIKVQNGKNFVFTVICTFNWNCPVILRQ